MKLEIVFTEIRVDLTTGSRSGSAVQVFRDDDTRVVYGNIYAQVTFLGIGLEVKMDPYKGEWENTEWARKQAWNAMRKNLTIDDLVKIIAATREAGEKTGDEQAREEIRTVLGIKEQRVYACGCGGYA